MTACGRGRATAAKDKEIYLVAIIVKDKGLLKCLSRECLDSTGESRLPRYEEKRDCLNAKRRISIYKAGVA